MFQQTIPSPVSSGPLTTDDDDGRRPTQDADLALQVFLAQRTHLVRVAYRVLGDATGAEDIVQEAWLRWQRADRRSVQNPAAFLTTTTTRLAINEIQSARRRRESPAEPALVEPADSAPDPVDQAEQTADAERALSILASALTRCELAAYLLRKAFDYPYREIAQLLRTSPANARQLTHRAQAHLTGGAAHPVDTEEYAQLVGAFVIASRTGDMGGLEALLAKRAGDLTPVEKRSRALAVRAA